ncbi:ImmA/IrrE family metallo-endopeptidase [Candidatus Poriferisodalis sp.]|uniref:ImmA/IrrE family metallo-endopeptidase n=1 Tax=Candidatus Poriferisodalis sp. TaxID=3101277 RepID=UPI003AF9D4B5
MNRRSLEREAVLAAEYVLAESDITPGDRVPVFDLIENRGIWLSFEPELDRLLGVYQRIGDVTGIAINTARPVALQRFTAAHELGHHELGHGSHLDAEATITESAHDPKEIQAQTFAASLLMSELAIETRLEHRGHDPDRPNLSAIDVYLIAAELGVSYQAAVTQLRVLHKISFAQAREFAKESPLRLKQVLLGGRRPDNPRASVVQLTFADNRREIVLDVDDEIDVALPEMPASGCEWTLPSAIGESFVLTNDRSETTDGGTGEMLFGRARARHVTLRAHTAGRTRLDFRPVQPASESQDAAPLTIYAVTRTAPVSEEGRGISVNQHDQLLERASA